MVVYTLEQRGYVNKENCRILGKADAAKTSHCLVQILVQRHNEQEEAVTVNGDRYRTMLNAFLFTQI